MQITGIFYLGWVAQNMIFTNLALNQLDLTEGSRDNAEIKLTYLALNNLALA
jgi:hypothetical protein